MIQYKHPTQEQLKILHKIIAAYSYPHKNILTPSQYWWQIEVIKTEHRNKEDVTLKI